MTILLWPDYRATVLRAPRRPKVPLTATRTELSGPVFGETSVDPTEADLTAQHGGVPIGERIIVHGQVRDSGGHPVPDTLVEVWQANAAGRYADPVDQHPAPLDPNFTGAGRCITDSDGRYRFVSVKPGAYPWRNHHNAWRPAHIHFSLFGRAFVQRLVTQMYFPGDPLLGTDPILAWVPADARPLLVAAFDPATTIPEWALAYRFDIVLRGAGATPMEQS